MINTYGCIYLKIKKNPLRFQVLGEPKNIYVAGCFFHGQVNAFVATQRILVWSTHMDAFTWSLTKTSAKVLSFGGAQKYTCCRMLFSHSSKCISLGACARDKAFFTPPHFPEWKLSFPTNILVLVAATYLGFLLYPKSLKGLLDLS